MTSSIRPASEQLDSMIERIGVVPRDEILRELLKRSATALNVERVGYWSMEDDGTAIRRELQFMLSRDDFETAPLSLLDSDFPTYFAALRAGSNLVVAADTMEDPRLVEFRETYFTPLGIGAMLDAPVHRHGRLFGVICHEHVGEPRHWTAEEIDFARYAAQWIALAVEIDSRQLAEQALRESEANYRMLIEHTPAATVIVDVESGRFVEANASAMRLYGRDREMLLSGGPVDVSPEFQPDGRASATAAGEAIGRALAGDDPRFDWIHLGAEEREIPCAVHLARMPGGRGNRVIATVTDRTEQIRTEETIRRALENEREVGEMRSRFTAIVSHEFRTPLGIIISAVELLGNYLDRLDTEKRGELLDDIRQSTKRMAALMEQVLVLGRAESGNLAFFPQTLDLTALCERLADESLSATVRRCPVDLTTDGVLDDAMADESLLRHILSNLVSNAAKYSAAGSPVTLKVRRDDGDAVFEIADRGIGIPPADQPRMFEAFQRAGNVGETPGTGLGLLIVKRCVELHCGTIGFESVPGEGTTFTVRLPLYP
ncbi:MAG: ATP-binding protein [Verrucomicrobiota bacterium]